MAGSMFSLFSQFGFTGVNACNGGICMEERAAPVGVRAHAADEQFALDNAVPSDMAELSGVTLESVVIATRTARAVRRLAEKGIVSLEEFPLMMHVDALINEGAQVDIPWEKFTMTIGD